MSLRDHDPGEIDWLHLDDMTAGEDDLAHQFLVLFLENAQLYIVALKDAPAKGDEWRRLCHKIKGAANAVGALNMAKSAYEGEVMDCADKKGRAAILGALETSLDNISNLLNPK